MTEEDAVCKMYKLSEGDPEAAHGEADDILIEFLKANGHEMLADAFEDQCNRIGFWYA